MVMSYLDFVFSQVIHVVYGIAILLLLCSFTIILPFFTFCRLFLDAVSQASPFFLHLFLRNIFILNDIHVKEGALFCDSIRFSEILYNEQVCMA